MNSQDIIQNAIHNLTQDGITAKWKEIDNDDVIDGKLKLHIQCYHDIEFNVEIKKELRTVHLDKIEYMKTHKAPYLIVADHIFPKIKQELKNKKINYLETSGNLFLFFESLYIYIEGRKNEQIKPKTANRAFTKTGLQIIYQFLLDENWVNRPYRDIADYTDTALGTINNIFSGLKKEGYLIQLQKNEYQLQNKKRLLEKWVQEYEKKLKPILNIGTFKFLKEDDFYNWKKINLKKDETFWGGEPAGAIYTNYLRPEELTIYTEEDWNDLIKNYKMIPEKNGPIKVYQKFWKNDNLVQNAVHPLLAYTDLINKEDRRCTETALKIYDEYLQDKF